MATNELSAVTEEQLIMLFGGEEDQIQGDSRALIFDAVETESSIFTSTVSKHPIDSGYETTDNITNRNRTFQFKVMVTDTPVVEVSSKNLLTQQTSETDSVSIKNAPPRFRAQAAYDQLTKLRDNRKLFTIITTYRIFYNCVITALRFPMTSANHMVAELSIEQLRLVSTLVDTKQLIVVIVKDDAEDTNQDGVGAGKDVINTSVENAHIQADGSKSLAGQVISDDYREWMKNKSLSVTP